MNSLILASASPRRAELLRQAGFVFEISPAAVDESSAPGESGVALVRRLAQLKAQTGQKNHADQLILAADTVVMCGKEARGKPANYADYVAMMQYFSGRTHEVITGVCVCLKERLELFHEITRVTFLTLPEPWIEAYWESGEPMDCAGGYAIQGQAGAYVRDIHGSRENVMGLPIHQTSRLLRSFGMEPAHLSKAKGSLCTAL